jgi:hypothetical protein
VIELRRVLGPRTGQAVAVGVTLWLLGETPPQAVSTAAVFLALTLVGDGADYVVGAHASHVALGVPALGGAGWLL